MGSDVTPVDGLSGILIPWALTHTGHPGAGDYTCAQTKPGPFVPSARTPLRIEATLPAGVTYPASVTRLDVQAISPGAAGVTRATSATGPAAGVAYKVNNAGDWYGHDTYNIPTGGVRRVVDVNSDAVGLAQPSMVALSTGIVVACYATTAGVFAATRTAVGVWTTGITVTGANVGALACICLAPDGALHIYAARPSTSDATPSWRIACYRSVDSGVTWIATTYDIGIRLIGSAEKGTAGAYAPTPSWSRIRAASTSGGAVVLFANTITAGPIYNVEQFVSTDGGTAFRQVLTATAGVTVWDVQPMNGTLHVVTCEGTALTYRSLANPAGSLLSTTGTGVRLTGAVAATDPACIVADPSGALYVQIADFSTPVPGLDGWRSIDNGATWTNDGPSYKANAAGMVPFVPALALSRGTMIGLFTRGTTSAGLYESRWGGNTNATIGSNIGTRADVMDSWMPLDLLSSCGWADTTGGTPTITLDVDASGNASQKIVNGAADTWASLSPTDTGATSPIQSVVIRVAAVGVVPVRILFRSRGANPGVIVEVNLTATQIRAFDFGGAAPAYVSHGGTSASYIEIVCICDPPSTHARAVIAYRVVDNTAERTFTTILLSSLTAQGADNRVQIFVGADSTAYIGKVSRAKAAYLTLGAGWEAPLARPYSLDPVPLSTAEAHTTGGIDLTMTAGIAAVDLVTQTSYPDSVYRLTNVLPTVSPSPRSKWKAGAITNQTLTFAVPARDRSALIGFYLDGLDGIGSLNVTCGLSVATVDLTQTFKYQALGGNAVMPSKTGTGAAGPWVKADELAGWKFKDLAGTIRTVTGNTEGALSTGSAQLEHRAVIYLDGTTDAETDASCVMYPPRALLLGHLAGDGTDDVTALTISILAAANPAGLVTDREMAVCAAGRVHVLGLSPDLGDVLAMDTAANVQTMGNGTRYAARRHKDRRRFEVAFANSPRQVSAMSGASTSPDFVVVTTAKAAAASRDGIPYVVEGLIRRIGSTDAPVVFVPYITKQSSTGWRAKVLGLDATIYGRIVSAFRREGVSYTGNRSGTQIYRVPTITFEEEI